MSALPIIWVYVAIPTIYFSQALTSSSLHDTRDTKVRLAMMRSDLTSEFDHNVLLCISPFSTN